MALNQPNVLFKAHLPETRLLVVEDEPDIAEFLKLAIVDWLLPRGRGAKVCDAVQQEYGRRPTPIMLSGGCGEQVQAVAQCKPDLYVPKPVTFQKLLLYVQGILAHTH